MISSIFTLLLVPVFPALAEPQITHGQALAKLENRLGQGHSTAATGGGSPVTQPVQDGLMLKAPELPPITGRIFEWSGQNGRDRLTPVLMSGISAETFRLTGLIESAGQQVAILNDGQKDHVVGLGSYLLNAYRVSSVSRGRVVLTPLDPLSGTTRIELSLTPQNKAGGEQ